jgi:hypothetical protein
VKEEQ